MLRRVWWIEVVALLSRGRLADPPAVVRTRGERPETHQRGFLLGQWLVTEYHFRQVLSLPGVNLAVHAKPKLAGQRAVDPVDLDFEATGDLLGGKARGLPLCLARGRVLARG